MEKLVCAWAYWSLGIKSVDTYLRKADTSFPSSHQMPIVLQLGIGFHGQIPDLFWSFDCLNLMYNFCMQSLWGKGMEDGFDEDTLHVY